MNLNLLQDCYHENIFFIQKTVDYMMGVSHTSVITYTHIIYKRVINVFFFKGELSASLSQALR